MFTGQPGRGIIMYIVHSWFTKTMFENYYENSPYVYLLYRNNNKFNLSTFNDSGIPNKLLVK